jgi:hypothetical protein
MTVSSGVQLYPTWASLARDYLPIMASSVSSERAFSLAGITISKRRNRLKGDIVEALECIKCLLHHNLIFRPTVTLEQIENELEDVEVDEELVGFREIVEKSEGFTWDALLDDEEEEIVPGASQDDTTVVD